MGSCFKALGKYPEARNSYRRAIALAPDDAISHYNLANLYRVIGSTDLSVTHYLQAIEQQ
jgi:protein O-GlcNAc transferase